MSYTIETYSLDKHGELKAAKTITLDSKYKATKCAIGLTSSHSIVLTKGPEGYTVAGSGTGALLIGLWVNTWAKK